MKWEVRGFNICREPAVLSWGETEMSFPDLRARKILRADGYKIYVDGKLFTEPDNKRSQGMK